MIKISLPTVDVFISLRGSVGHCFISFEAMLWGRYTPIFLIIFPFVIFLSLMNLISLMLNCYFGVVWLMASVSFSLFSSHLFSIKSHPYSEKCVKHRCTA